MSKPIHTIAAELWREFQNEKSSLKERRENGLILLDVVLEWGSLALKGLPIPDIGLPYPLPYHLCEDRRNQLSDGQCRWMNDPNDRLTQAPHPGRSVYYHVVWSTTVRHRRAEFLIFSTHDDAITFIQTRLKSRGYNGYRGFDNGPCLSNIDTHSCISNRELGLICTEIKRLDTRLKVYRPKKLKS
jgi:hypothetical protein